MSRVLLKSAHHPERIVEVQVKPGQTVLQAFQDAGQSLAASCDGILLCGACWMRILEGAESLPTAGDREAETLRGVRAPEDARLACRIRPTEDLVVQVPYR